jgi:hypothetical protein
MNEILDLLPIPAERDFPPGQLEARRDALVAAAGASTSREPLTHRALRAARGAWLSLLGILALGAAVIGSGLPGQHRPVPSGAVAVLAATGAAQIAVAAAPAIGSAALRPLESRRP